MKQLNIHKFFTKKGRQYIFDNVSGTVVPGNDAICYIVENFFSQDKAQILNNLVVKYGLGSIESTAYYGYVNDLIDKGFFYQEIMSPSPLVLGQKFLFGTQMSILNLIVTEECNLRCKYCVYSDKYPKLKGYSKKHMNFDTAKRAIEIYMQLHRERQERGLKKNPIITFYGGEPLLEFDLIQEVINYCNSQGYDPTYYITSNGTLMTDEIIDLIISNKMVFTISLDGEKHQHDRNRVFKNQKGSFDLILENISKLQKEKIKRGVDQLLTFNCSYDSYTDLEAVVDFFEKHSSLFQPFQVFWAQIAYFNTTYYDDLDKLNAEGTLSGSSEDLYKSMSKLSEKFNQDIIQGNDTSSTLNSLFLPFPLLKNRLKGSSPVLKNACSPSNKLAVDPDGYFYACERMNQQLPIGNVQDGIDIEKISALVNQFLEIWNENCASCSLSRLCEICYLHFASDNQLRFNQEFCDSKKQSIPRVLSDLYSVLEENPKAFDNILEFTDLENHEVLMA